jgi:hypothetical protein
MAGRKRGNQTFWGKTLEHYNIHALRLIWQVVRSATRAKMCPIESAAITLLVMDSLILENKKHAKNPHPLLWTSHRTYHER